MVLGIGLKYINNPFPIHGWTVFKILDFQRVSLAGHPLPFLESEFPIDLLSTLL